jgi:uroporphyrin-III C-methyltransferase
MTKRGKVFLVGAGPGDPELLTLRARRVIESADAILHDALVSQEILAIASPAALIEDVGKRCGAKRMRQEEIHERMIELAIAGLTVARLQGGDPVLFGRAGEEIAALESADVDWEIVPGVTSASAAAAAVGIPLTDRRASAQLILLTGHRAGEISAGIPLPPTGGATVVVYMPCGPYEEIAARFRAAGWGGETPCVVVSAASTPQQRVLRTTLETLGCCERLPAPALLIVGEVAGLNREAEKSVAVVAQAS